MIYNVTIMATITMCIVVEAENEAVAQEKAAEAYRVDRLGYLQDAICDVMDVVSIEADL